MPTKSTLLEDIKEFNRVIEERDKDLQAAKDKIIALSASNFDLRVRVEKLERAFLQKCLDELK